MEEEIGIKKFAAAVLCLCLLLPSIPVYAVSPTGDQIVDVALSLQGKVQYAHAFDPSRLIFDCSGFTWYVYKQVGIELGTRDDDKQALLGQYVQKSELQKGDLIFFWNSASTSKTDVGHVGIYIGDGKYVHNANSANDVVVSSLSGTYATEHYIMARRILTGIISSPPVTGTTPPSPPSTDTPPPAPATSSSQGTVLADKIVDFAVGLKGRVAWASTYDAANLRFSSSGYTYYVFKQFGIDLKSSTSAIQALQGRDVSAADLRKGDLVFFWNSSSTSKTDIRHVGIYIGDGKYIQNANATYDVVISDFNGSYAKEHFIKARRVIPE